MCHAYDSADVAPETRESWSAMDSVVALEEEKTGFYCFEAGVASFYGEAGSWVRICEVM
jgi:hypothetical protein